MFWDTHTHTHILVLVDLKMISQTSFHCNRTLMRSRTFLIFKDQWSPYWKVCLSVKMDLSVQLWEVLSTPTPTQQQITKSEFLKRAHRDNPCYCRGQWIRGVACRWHRWLSRGCSRPWKIHHPKLVNSSWDNVMMARVQGCSWAPASPSLSK